MNINLGLRDEKYRVYDLNEEEIIAEGLTLEDRLDLYVDDGDNILDQEGTVIVPYVGMKDKQKKEIYAGDIIEAHTFDENIEKLQIGTVEYHTGRYGFVFVPNHLRSKNLYYPLFAVVTCKVIGNVIQNKDLLTD